MMQPTIIETILPVFKGSIDVQSSECQLALRGIREESHKGYSSPESSVKSAFMSSWLSHKENKNFLPLVEVVTERCRHVLREFFSIKKYVNIECVNCWGAVYEPGDYTLHHHHVPFLLSACVYLQLSDNSSNIFFDDTEMPVQEGDILVFPGYLRHRVPATEGHRIVVAMNFIVTPPSSNEEYR
jgi:hypothetical protein